MSCKEWSCLFVCLFCIFVFIWFGSMQLTFFFSFKKVIFILKPNGRMNIYTCDGQGWCPFIFSSQGLTIMVFGKHLIGRKVELESLTKLESGAGWNVSALGEGRSTCLQLIALQQRSNCSTFKDLAWRENVFMQPFIVFSFLFLFPSLPLSVMVVQICVFVCEPFLILKHL